ncbi:hypothetical protein LGM43_26575 [Burkholderia seminalis]|uniref:gp53-like domain-containing protein n=1 Tax=Burkholderia seminalis TaxID=488731 RepID=UPI001CF4E18C|nr:hypothetical protein [Burkholderia seminalis]MCA7953838.1 hypothetical protein [Burkholderia seminalis]
MSVENDFLPFATGVGANVLSQAAYASMTALGTGFQAGVAQSAALNKVWRQSSIMSAVLAQFVVARTGQPAIDDGTTATLLLNLLNSSAAPNGDPTQNFSAKAPAANDNSNLVPPTSWLWSNIQALVSSCIAAVANAAGFSASIGSPGYIKFPSWLGSWIVQWGSTGLTNSSGVSSVSFPLAFPSANLGLVVSPAMGGTSSPAIVGFSNQTVSGFNFWAATPSSSPFTNAGGNYIAVGK